MSPISSQKMPFISFPHNLLFCPKSRFGTFLVLYITVYICCYLNVPLRTTSWAESDGRDARPQEQKDDGTICTIGGEGREGEWQREGETSTCLMVIGDITYTNNEAEDDNIFCMTSVFVKAVLTQGNGTLNHPHASDMYVQWHAQTHLKSHARTKRFHFTFSRLMSYKVCNCKRWEGDIGSLCRRERYALFVSQYASTQRWEINAALGNTAASVTQDH